MKTTELNSITTPDAADVIPIADVDASETKKLAFADLGAALLLPGDSWSPTFAADGNIDGAVTLLGASWARAGEVILVSGLLSLTALGAGLVQLSAAIGSDFDHPAADVIVPATPFDATAGAFRVGGARVTADGSFQLAFEAAGANAHLVGFQAVYRRAAS